MRARAELMRVLDRTIRERDMTEQEAAALFGVTQPRISDLVRNSLRMVQQGKASSWH